MIFSNGARDGVSLQPKKALLPHHQLRDGSAPGKKQVCKFCMHQKLKVRLFYHSPVINAEKHGRHGRHLVGDMGSHAPFPLPTFGSGVTEYLMSTPHFLGLNFVYIFQYLCLFYGHFYWTCPDHMFSLSTCIQIF